MADNQDKLTLSDQQKLEQLEQQLSADKVPPAKSSENPAGVDAKTSTRAAIEPKKPSDTAAPPTKRTATAAHTAKGKTGGLWFVSLVNLLLLAALVAAGYWLWLQWQSQNQQQTQQLTVTQGNIARQQQQINDSINSNQLVGTSLERQTLGLQQQVAALKQQNQQIRQQQQANQNNLADLSGRRPADWLLAEADYLVRMAGRKLWLEHDLNTAIMMLESADSRLQDLDDPSLLPIRERLAADIVSLQQVNPVNTSSIALTLGALAEQVKGLPLAFFKKPEAANTDNSIIASQDNWRSNLARNWQQVTQDFFSVKRKTVDIKPFMSQQEQWLAQQQLFFALQQAQVAILKEQQALYQQALTRATALLGEFFAPQQSAVIQFRQSLNELQQLDSKRIYPTQLSVAPLLEDMIDRRLQSRFVNATSSEDLDSSESNSNDAASGEVNQP
jgi:uroporphyrin-3 C-methyltransferase